MIYFGGDICVWRYCFVSCQTNNPLMSAHQRRNTHVDTRGVCTSQIPCLLVVLTYKHKQHLFVTKILVYTWARTHPFLNISMRCVCVCVCVPVCLCMSVYIYIYMNICVYGYVCVCACVTIRLSTRTHVFEHMCVCVCVCVRVCVL